MDLPTAFLDRMAALLGDEFPAFQAHYQRPADIGLRVNTLKITPPAWERISPFPLERVPWTQAGYRVTDPNARPGRHPYHVAGLYYLQDPSAMAVGALLDPQPGERVLDLAAAPGGKTTHLAARMQGRGMLVANDVHPTRVRDLANNLERWGAPHTVVLNETPPRLADHFGAFFDRVLVDAPCSGEGMFRKDPAARDEWSLKAVQRCARRQGHILADAARLVRPGGYLMYSTCTFAPEENEGTLARFLDAHPDFEMVPLPAFPGFDHAHPDWVQPSAPETVRHALRLWPHRVVGEGHFVALMRRDPDADAVATARPFPRRLPREAGALYDAFCEEQLHAPPAARHTLALQGNVLYALPHDMPDLHGLRVVHWGRPLGKVKPNRFEPAHALALTIRPEQARHVFDQAPDHPDLLAYLRGETLPADGGNAWVLVCVDGFPLGWARRAAGRLKSKCPPWLRRMR